MPEYSCYEDSVLSKKPWRIAFAFYSVFIIGLGVAAYLGKLPPIKQIIHPHIDLVGHALFIGLLGGLFDGVLGFRTLFEKRLSFLRFGPTIIIVVAGIEEALQDFSPNRSSTWSDFVADVVGILLFSFVALRVERWRERRLHAKKS